jgi:type I restriction enzyme S subunit
MKEANFKETEIGKIPVDWEVEYLGENLAENPKYGINAASVPFNSNLPTYLRITDISDDGRYLNNSPVSVNNSESSKYFLEEGDLVFARTGASVGKTYLYNLNDGRLVYAGFLIKLKPDNQTLNSVFLKYLTQNKFYKDWIIQNSMRTGQPGINGIQIKSFQIPLPPLSEQEKIAEVLSDTDLWIESTEALLAKKRQIKKGAMQKLLSPKEDWEVRKLGEVGEIITGGTPSTLNKEFWNGNIAWITPTDISNTSKNIFKGERSISEIGYKQIRQLPKNSLLVTCIASIGKNAILRAKGACNQQINAIIPNEGNNVDFIYYLIELNKSVLMGKAGTTATLMLSKAEFSLIEFSFPPLEKQQEIAEILSSMDLEIESLENRLQKARQLKQGMMQDLLTGKVRLG